MFKAMLNTLGIIVLGFGFLLLIEVPLLLALGAVVEFRYSVPYAIVSGVIEILGHVIVWGGVYFIYKKQRTAQDGFTAEDFQKGLDSV